MSVTAVCPQARVDCTGKIPGRIRRVKGEGTNERSLVSSRTFVPSANHDMTNKPPGEGRGHGVVHVRFFSSV